MFTEEQLRQKIAVAYKTGFHAGIKWAKEGTARDKPANHVPLTRA